jgi:N-acylglucosamine-6-phosphate 2-epimerase
LFNSIILTGFSNPMPTNALTTILDGSFVVSCQAPINSPLHHPDVIAAMAETAILRGAGGVRIESPDHVKAVRSRIAAPIIGLWKQQIQGFDVYITPQAYHADAIAQAGADIIAIDATQRPRPDGETLRSLVDHIHHYLNRPVMADIDTLENAVAAIAIGVDCVGTTLYGYTGDTQNQTPPGFDLLTALVKQSTVPVICEGGLTSPDMARHAIDRGADCVVVGTAITGIDSLVSQYVTALTKP